MNLKTLTIILCATLLFACTKTDPKQVTITGKITNPIGESVIFSNQDTAYSTTANKDGSFSISFLLDSAEYLNFEHGVERTAMFVKPSDKINLTIDTELFDETIKYEGSEESSFLAKLYLLEEENDFFAAMDSLNSEQFSNMLEGYSAEFLALLSKVTDADFIVKAKERIKNTTSNWGDRKTAIDNMPKEGEPAIDFTYPDKDGNEFSLASFKGTLIYVDVWATWCGPCKAEIPYLQKLEEEYQGYCTITFLSVSVDTDKDAWLKMVAEKEMGGIQLWADGWSEITKSYAIFGIPRFMLFSADGNVISTNAPRPSSDEIRGLLDANLGGLPNL